MTVLTFCKACWKAGAHRAAEVLEDAAKVEMSSSLSSWESSDDLVEEESSSLYQFEFEGPSVKV